MPRKSISTYPPNWAEIAQYVKDAAKGRCIRCAREDNPEAGYMLTVHHLDMDKGNCAWWNIPALCQRCHLTIQAKVTMNQGWMFDHSDWFKPYAAAYYGVLAGLLPATRDYFDSLILVRREFVEARMDYLLTLGKPQEIGA